MKILHTSDWHLGQLLYNYDRTEEHQDMLRQMADIVSEHKPDVFVLCGDVFHTAQPSSAVQTMFSNALVKIHDANPSMTIVVTAGNHDSGTRHEIHRTPWKALNVHTVGSIDRESLDEQIVEIPGKGYIIAVPYVNERSMPDGYYQQLLDRVAQRNTDGLPVVLTAHTTVRGCDITGHEQSTDSIVGGIDALDISLMGDGYDYLALGHIHHEQFIHTGNHNVRYSGTPVAVSFDENYAHSVSMVNIARHGDKPVVDKIQINNTHPLVTLPTEDFVPLDEALRLFREYPDDIPSYIRLNVAVDDFLPPTAEADAHNIAKDKACRFCHINAKRRQSPTVESKALSVQEFQAVNPIDVAMHYAEDTGVPFDDDMKMMFGEVLDLLEEQSRND